MTTFYVDSSATGAQDGTSETDAWNTLEYAISQIILHSTATGDTGTAASDGDTIIVRRTHNEVWDQSATKPVRFLTLTSPGVDTPMIIAADGHSLVGQSGTWSGDSSSAVPLIDGNQETSGNHYFELNRGQLVLVVAGLKFQDFGSGASGGPSSIWRNPGQDVTVSFRDCEFQDWDDYAIWHHRSAVYFEFIDCTFDSSGSSTSPNAGMLVTGYLRLVRCTFTSCGRGLSGFGEPWILEMEDCEFGGGSGAGENTVGDIVAFNSAARWIMGRNNDLKSAPHFHTPADVDALRGPRVFLTDYDITQSDLSTPGDSSSSALDFFEMTGQGRIRRDTDTVDTANDATWSARFEPNIEPISSAGDDANESITSVWPVRVVRFERYVGADTFDSAQLRVYFENWTSVPDETEFYVIARYFNGSGGDRDTVTSTTDPSATGNDAWISIDVPSFTTATAGPVIFEVWLETEENDDEVVYVSPMVLGL